MLTLGIYFLLGCIASANPTVYLLDHSIQVSFDRGRYSLSAMVDILIHNES